ncbi:hypothetical protein LGM58_41550, partial [Burkholderia contaminans]|uniref:hypothetical protein n=1 Tax=Burkholderia contaminans TaxID=488447 RepID=UPI001CF2C66D
MPKQPQLTTPLTPLAATLFWSVFHAAWGLDRDSSHYNKAAWQYVHQSILAAAGQHLDSSLLVYALRNVSRGGVKEPGMGGVMAPAEPGVKRGFERFQGCGFLPFLATA